MSDLIDRQAAIDAIENAFDRETILNSFVRKIAISAVRLLPPAQLGTNLAEVGTREVRGYPIDADALMEKVAEEYGERARDRLYQIIRYMPPAQHEQRTGKWIRNGWAITCSECGYDMPYTVRNFCPNCGAKMEGVNNDT